MRRLSLRQALLVMLAVLALLAAACGSSSDGDSDEAGGDSDGEAATSDTSVGIVYDIGGRGDQSFNDAAFEGLDRAAGDLGIDATDLEPDAGGENREELLRNLADSGSDLVIGVGFLFDESIKATALDHPDTSFGIIDGFVDPAEAPNVASLGFAEEQGSFLVGAAAATKSTTGKLGFIGGVETDLIKKFEAGFAAGAREINPDIEIDVKYITQPPDFSGFNDPAKGKEIALSMFGDGADIVYAAAGGSGGGMFEAAKEVSEEGEKVWGVGVDSDQYQTVDPALQEYVLTSMIKRVDVAVYNTIKSVDDGSFVGEPTTFDLSVDGVGYSTSGGFIEDIVTDLEELKTKIIDGDIVVPTAP